MPKDDALAQKLNRETAKIPWLSLLEHHQRGAVIDICPSLDLITVATEFARDNRSQVETWLKQSKLVKVTEKQADYWANAQAELWAVVVSPWVLVQTPKEATQI